MEHQILNLFPLSIYKSSLGLTQNYKDELIEEIYEMIKNSSQPDYNKNNNSWTGDTQGHDKLHENKRFSLFFVEISKHIKKYVEYFEIDLNKLDFYFQRSWATLSNGKENIKHHRHMQSHLSFAYYLKKSNKDANIQFVNLDHPNEFIPSLFLSKTVGLSNIFTNRNIKNSSIIDLNCFEDDIIIFPSKSRHGTQSSIENDNRISISADILITAKDSKNIEHMMPPLNQWKKI
tara:strand:- start:243 stop:941 length:699 start_codon:yes stop_codon:yes gene_type:complete